MVDRKWIFHREAKVELQGKELFRIEDLELIRKKYEEEKKKYLLKEKVDLQWDLSKHPHLDESIAEVGNMKISVADFKTIQYPISAEEEEIMKKYHKTGKFNPGWLNDEVINASFKVIQMEEETKGKRVICKNTFLYRKLEKLNSESSLSELKAGWINKVKFCFSHYLHL